MKVFSNFFSVITKLWVGRGTSKKCTHCKSNIRNRCVKWLMAMTWVFFYSASGRILFQLGNFQTLCNVKGAQRCWNVQDCPRRKAYLTVSALFPHNRQPLQTPRAPHPRPLGLPKWGAAWCLTKENTVQRYIYAPLFSQFRLKQKWDTGNVI